jgi:4'-phosphopantetheinyl transferase
MSRRFVRVWLEPNTGAGQIERVLARVLGVSADEVLVDSACIDCGRPHGKPRVLRPRRADGGEIVVSKSGVAGWVAIAVSLDGGDLGVDVESLVQMSRARVDEAAFSPAERDLIDDADPALREELRTRLWSRKEAYLKASGVGLRVDLTTVDLASGFAVDAVLVDVPTGDPELVLSVAMLGSDPVTVELVSEPAATREDAR